VESYSGNAVIRRGEREVHVVCDLQSWREEPSVLPGVPGLLRWEGTFATPGTPSLEAGAATIELPDGRTGDVNVTVEVRNRDEFGTLVGSGDPPF
jgi:hypothetical protein